MSNMKNYAKAIAIRITDEWSGKQEFPEDASLLREILTELLLQNPEKCQKLISTGIIEENYFDELK